MPIDEKMSVNERRKYLKLVKPRYQKVGKEGRGKLLTEMEEITGLHRKSLIRLMNMESLERAPWKPRLKRGRYDRATSDVVRLVWESLDYVCAERLTPALPDTARQLAKWGELTISAEIEEKLSTISRATVQRLLERFQWNTPKLPRKRPQPPNRLLRDVPMERLSRQTTEPGSFEADLVHHCGAVAAGDYIHTLQLVDIATGWSERVAVWGRSQQAVMKGFKKVQERLSFSITHLHPDNGSEFFNDHLIRYFGEHITGLRLSRSRPYHKNDNRFVEQKNSSLVRAYTGYERLDKANQYVTLNILYDRLRLYYNFFRPVLHLAGKEVIKGKLHRRWGRAKTPYQRLVAAGVLSPEQEKKLAELYAQTNPRQLRNEIYQTIDRLYTVPFNNEVNIKKEAASVR